MLFRLWREKLNYAQNNLDSWFPEGLLVPCVWVEGETVIYTTRFVLEKWTKPPPNSPNWHEVISVHWGGVCKKKQMARPQVPESKHTGTVFLFRASLLWSVVFVCGGEKVSMGALAPPETRLFLTSVSQLADWRENIPAPFPLLSLHTPLPPTKHPQPTREPASQPVW